MDFIGDYLATTADLQRRMAERGPALVAAADALVACFRGGGKLLLCGNGGSAADCQHVAAELMSRLSRDFDRPALPAVALTTDTSFLTAFANDVDYDGIFERQVRGLGRPGDALVGISTSGGSTNVIRAIDAASELGMVTIGLMGEGGRMEGIVDHAIVVPSRETQHVQEALLPVEHLLCHLVESSLFPRHHKDTHRGS